MGLIQSKTSKQREQAQREAAQAAIAAGRPLDEDGAGKASDSIRCVRDLTILKSVRVQQPASEVRRRRQEIREETREEGCKESKERCKERRAGEPLTAVAMSYHSFVAKIQMVKNDKHGRVDLLADGPAAAVYAPN